MIAQTLTVHTSQHNYPIVISRHKIAFDNSNIKPYIKGNQVLIVTNETVAPLYLDSVIGCLQGLTVQTCILADGEQYKVQSSIDRIYDVLMSSHFGRECTLIALGGGVIGDMTGFAAASFMRGVDFIQIPTTLLAQVDSSVGGKTGINHSLGKNMIGAFWQPVCVLADMATIKTLPDREFSAGMAEVIKYALIMDKAFLAWLIDNADNINAKTPSVLSEMVYRCCTYKAQIVGMDEKESGVRALLNLGHTFGHAIETYMGYGNWLHGEAVSAGIMQAAYLSYLQKRLSREEVEYIAYALMRFHLPTVPPQIDPKTALSLMGHDKKVKAGKIRFVLLDGIGQGVIAEEVPLSQVEQVLSTTYQSIL